MGPFLADFKIDLLNIKCADTVFSPIEFLIVVYSCVTMLLQLLSRFSRVRLYVTP